MVKEAKDTEMAMAKAVEGSEHDLEPRKLEYSPSRKPRLAPDPPELGDTRVGSIALMAFCFVGLQVPRCPPSFLTLLRARTLCTPFSLSLHLSHTLHSSRPLFLTHNGLACSIIAIV